MRNLQSVKSVQVEDYTFFFHLFFFLPIPISFSLFSLFFFSISSLSSVSFFHDDLEKQAIENDVMEK